MDVDDTDRRVLNALLRDGRADATEIAGATGIAATTVSRRLDRLEEGGVIEEHGVDIDYAALGYDVTAIFQLAIGGPDPTAVADRLADHARMTDVYEITGEFDVIAVGKFRDTEEMNERIKQILTDDEVAATTTSVVLDVVTENEQFQLDTDDDESRQRD